MSYFLADSTGELTDFASIGGLADFHAWAMRQKGVIAQFARNGFTENLEGLVAELLNAKAVGPVDDARLLLIRTARAAKDILIVTDGMSLEGEGLTAASSKTPMMRMADKLFGNMSVSIRFAFAKGRQYYAQEGKVGGIAQVVQDALEEVLPAALLRAVASGAQVGIEKLRKKGRPSTFDVKSVTITEWISQHTLDVAKQMGETSETQAAKALIDGEDISIAIGDETRAGLAAQNEVWTGLIWGQREAWKQSVASTQGLTALASLPERMWVSYPGACDDCDEMDGETTPMDEDYSNGVYGPPLHTHCQCDEDLVEDDSE